jgi:hypothetical protein
MMGNDEGGFFDEDREVTFVEESTASMTPEKMAQQCGHGHNSLARVPRPKSGRGVASGKGKGGLVPLLT